VRGGQSFALGFEVAISDAGAPSEPSSQPMIQSGRHRRCLGRRLSPVVADWSCSQVLRAAAAGLRCIDSRAPAELIFDAAIGETFNARIADHVVNDAPQDRFCESLALFSIALYLVLYLILRVRVDLRGSGAFDRA
jgi:hypothetical protein